MYLVAKIGVDTVENELSKVCRSKQAIPNPGDQSGSANKMSSTRAKRSLRVVHVHTRRRTRSCALKKASAAPSRTRPTESVGSSTECPLSVGKAGPTLYVERFGIVKFGIFQRK